MIELMQVSSHFFYWKAIPFILIKRNFSEYLLNFGNCGYLNKLLSLLKSSGVSIKACWLRSEYFAVMKSSKVLVETPESFGNKNQNLLGALANKISLRIQNKSFCYQLVEQTSKYQEINSKFFKNWIGLKFSGILHDGCVKLKIDLTRQQCEQISHLLTLNV